MSQDVQLVAEERQEGETHQQVVQRCDNGADRERELEAQRDIDQDAAHRQHRRPDPLAPQLLADDGTHDRRLDRLFVERADICRFQRVDDAVRLVTEVATTLFTDPPDAKASPSQKPYDWAIPLAMSEKEAVHLSAATTR